MNKHARGLQLHLKKKRTSPLAHVGRLRLTVQIIGRREDALREACSVQAHDVIYSGLHSAIRTKVIRKGRRA